MWRTAAAMAGLALVVGCSAPIQQFHDETGSVSTARHQTVHVPDQKVIPRQPNIVLVLMDDFSLDLVQTMRSAQAMSHAGASYSHAYVVDSLCCVSRASLFTGQYPHQTGVRTNTANTPNPIGPVGGWEAFETYGNAERSFNVRLQRAGYTTGFIGKYLNQYAYAPGGQVPPVPPGWSHWQAVLSSAYNGWDFESTVVEDGQVRIRHHPAPPAEASVREKDEAYVGTMIQDEALDFLRERRGDRAPYFLQVATYGPHSRVVPIGHYPGDPGFPPAFRDRIGAGNCGAVSCTSLDLTDLPGAGDDQADNAPRRRDGTPAPRWRTFDPTPSEGEVLFHLPSRAQMVQSIDRMLARILRAVDDNTYVTLTSDNGFHLGQHGLGLGKGTPFDSDVHVPLLVVGPGVEQGARSEVVSNLDLAATFEDLAGLAPAPYRSGLSLVPTLEDAAVDRRGHTFFQHTYAPSLGLDPDASYAGGSMDLIPSYVAVRSRTALLVRLDLDPSWEGVEHAWEFYDYTDVGWEQTNEYGAPEHRAAIAGLTRKLDRLDDCAAYTRDDAVPGSCRRLTQ